MMNRKCLGLVLVSFTAVSFSQAFDILKLCVSQIKIVEKVLQCVGTKARGMEKILNATLGSPRYGALAAVICNKQDAIPEDFKKGKDNHALQKLQKKMVKFVAKNEKKWPFIVQQCSDEISGNNF
ncbi:uncharacterized protein LOC144173499 [Haemaphysalis longicornis]